MANVNTDGYTRQSVVLEVSRPQSFSAGFLGRGVRAAYITQSYSRFIEAQLLGQQQNLGKSSVMSDVFSRVEQVFNSFSGSGLSNSLQSFFNSWNALSADASSFAYRTVLLADANSLVNVSKQMEASLYRNIGEIDKEIQNTSDRINAIANGIAKLNKEIVKVEAGSGHRANDLRDSRNTLLTELAGMVPVSTLEDTRGSMTVIVGMRNLVEGVYVNEMTSSVDALGNVSIKIDGVDVASRIDKGRLGGLIESRKAIEQGPLKELRKFMAALTLEINGIHAGGYGLDGSTGNDFFSPLTLSTNSSSYGASVSAATITDPSALTLSEYNVNIGAGGAYTVQNRDTGAVVASGTYVSGAPIDFDGISITVTGAAAEGDSFFVSPLTNAIRDASVAITDGSKIAAAYDPGAPGDNRNALDIAKLAEEMVGRLGGSTFAGFYAKIVTMSGSMSSDAADMYKFEVNLRAELQSQRDSISGVSIDEEAASLLIFQRGFEAAARLITVADELIQTVLNL